MAALDADEFQVFAGSDFHNVSKAEATGARLFDHETLLMAAAVQTYINRQVPLALQGRTFALQGAVRNGAAIFPLVSMGLAASLVGVDTVLLASPILLLAVAYGLIFLSSRLAGVPTPSRLEVVESFWEEPDLEGGG